MSALRLPAPVFLGRVLGIPVLLDWSWIPMIPIYSWAIAGVYLPNTAPNQSIAEYWILGVATTAMFVVSVVAHELAHAVVARAEGLEIHDIVVHLFGGMARMSSEPATAAAELKIAVVGPGMSFALGVAFLLVDTLLVNGTAYVAEGRVLRHLGIVNLVLATFNLLPGFPLDGGRVLKAILWKRRGDAASALRTARSAGRSIAISLLGVGMYVYVFSDKLVGLWAMMFGAVLLLALGSRDRALPRQTASTTVANFMRRSPITISPATTVSDIVNDVLPEHRQTSFFVCVDGRLHGVMELESIRDLPKSEWHRTPASAVMRAVDDTLFVTTSTTIDDAKHLLADNGIGCAAVLDADGIVVGSVSPKELANPRR